MILKKRIQILTIMMLIVSLLFQSCATQKSQGGQPTETVPDLLIYDNEVYCISINQPSDLRDHSDEFVYLFEVANQGNYKEALGTAYRYGEDVVVLLNSSDEYYLYNPYEKCGRFETSESLSEDNYRSFMDEKDGVLSDKLKTFLYSLRSSEAFSFISIVNQPIYIYDKDFPEEFLDGYEAETWDHNENSRFTMDGHDVAFVKAIEVSEKFFSEYNINTIQGTIFDSDDYNYDLESNRVPILMGSEYSKYYKVGDVLTGEYLTKETTYVVKGFLPEGTKYWKDYKFNGLDRYIVLPVFITDDTLPFAKAHLLQQAHGVIITERPYDETNETFTKLLKDADLEDWEIYLIRPQL